MQTFVLISVGLMILPLCFMSIAVLAPEENDRIVQIIWGKWMTFALSAYLIFILVLYVEIFQNCMRMDLSRNYSLWQSRGIFMHLYIVLVSGLLVMVLLSCVINKVAELVIV